MAKAEWGTKRQCASCGSRFYDLNHDPIACPECGAVFEVEALARVKRLRAGPRADAVVKVAEIDVEVDEEDIEDEDAVLVDEEDEEAALPVGEEADDVAPAAAAEPEIEDDGLEVDDDVLLEADDEADDDLEVLVEDKDEEDLRP